MEQPSMFHPGMRALQDEFDGRRVADALEAHRKHRDFLPDEVELITSVPFFFVASHYADAVDCSFKGGVPGFVQVVGPAALEWPEYDGNSMYRTLGNIALSPRVGLLFIRFDGASTLTRMTGDASLVRDAETLARHHGAKSVVRFQAELRLSELPALHTRAADGRRKRASAGAGPRSPAAGVEVARLHPRRAAGQRSASRSAGRVD